MYQKVAFNIIEQKITGTDSQLFGMIMVSLAMQLLVTSMMTVLLISLMLTL